eukprot:1157683-Pelagomonas_calceolata.AAC.4
MLRTQASEERVSLIASALGHQLLCVGIGIVLVLTGSDKKDSLIATCIDLNWKKEGGFGLLLFGLGLISKTALDNHERGQSCDGACYPGFFSTRFLISPASHHESSLLGTIYGDTHRNVEDTPHPWGTTHPTHPQPTLAACPTACMTATASPPACMTAIASPPACMRATVSPPACMTATASPTACMRAIASPTACMRATASPSRNSLWCISYRSIHRPPPRLETLACFPNNLSE